MTKEEFENKFYQLVDPYIESYPGPVILSWYTTKPTIPIDFLNHLPAPVQEKVIEWAKAVE